MPRTNTPVGPGELARHLVPARANGLPDNLLDLSSFYNQGLFADVGSKTLRGNNYAELPHGLQTFGGIPFDLRGIVQLSGESLRQFLDYPKAVNGIAVHRTVRRIHLLGATCWAENDREVIAQVVVHSNTRVSTVLPLYYGEDFRDCTYVSDQESQVGRGKVVWAGKNAADRLLRVYKTTLQVPEKFGPVESIDIISSMSFAAPFVMAITVE
jgi:hypothetical protein